MDNAGRPKVSSIFELAESYAWIAGRDAQALLSLFDIQNGTASCRVGPELSSKYGIANVV